MADETSKKGRGLHIFDVVLKFAGVAALWAIFGMLFSIQNSLLAMQTTTGSIRVSITGPVSIQTASTFRVTADQGSNWWDGQLGTFSSPFYVANRPT
ncbi:hypothetical protein MN608_01481 [Microdochium nivale]|nr:hypothetical protein MN608_01481 [Microdochium nivale]